MSITRPPDVPRPDVPRPDGLGLDSPRRADPGRLIRAIGRLHVPTRVLVAAVIGVWALAVVLLVWSIAASTGPPMEPVPVR